MHESSERGLLLLNGQAMPESALARLLGLDKQNLTNTLTTLLEFGVASRCESTGALVCRRMVRDEKLRQIRKECGKKGGNPHLLNQNTTNQDNQNSTTHLNQKTTPSSSSSFSTTVGEEKKETPVRGDVCTLDQALAFAKANVMPPINAECATQWHDHMLSIGWQINNMPICDWRAALRRWASKWNTNTQFQKNEQKPSPHKGITESIPLKKL